jgi:hypothetical protein
MSNQTKKPLSEARLAANRANARKSTGPKTAAGKLRSAANACQHGFAGNNFAVVRLENPDDIDKLKADLVAVYQPINSQEMLAVICEQPAAEPEPLCTPFELNPFAFPHPDLPPDPNQSFPNEATASDQPVETKPVSSPVVTPAGPALKN